MEFGVAVPNCTEGMAYPIRFTDHEGMLRIAVELEELGYDSAMVNDHYSTMPYVREMFDEPPRFYEPLISLAYIAARTSRIKLMTGVVVMPMREPVVLAKQVATLDQMSGGRLTLGLGVGSYRAEFESVRPLIKDTPRSGLVDEGIESLQALFNERRATYRGKYLAFDDVELFPKPLQTPFPILACGNAPGTIRRAATLCAGWMPAGLPVDRMAAGAEQLRELASAAGRDPAQLQITPQSVLCIDRSDEAAAERFRRSQVYEHLMSLRGATLKNVEVEAFMSQNLIGTPEEVIRRIQRMADAGATHLAGMIVVANREDEMLEQLRFFAREVLPAFAKAAA